MAVNSKNKGNTFERKIANLLCERFAVHTGIDKSFRRNPDSGSFFGGSNFKRTETHDTEKASYGDIIAPASFNFNIECKHYKDAPSFSSIVKQEYATFDKWIGQAEQDSNVSGKLVMIIMKFNNVPETVMVPRGTFPELHVMCYKNYEIAPLEKVLELSDQKFFNDIS
jgi:hypothetical protein